MSSERYAKQPHVDRIGSHEDRAGDAARRAFVDGGLKLTVRLPLPDEWAFITSTWLRSFRTHAPAGVSNQIYYAATQNALEQLWKTPNVVWLVACAEGYPTFMLGWLAAELTEAGPVIHFVYVRHAVDKSVEIRRLGIATALVETFLRDTNPRTVWYTHSTPSARALLSAKGLHAPAPGQPGWEYHPYMFYKYFR